MSEMAVGESRFSEDNGEIFRADAGEPRRGLWLLHNISFSSHFVGSRCVSWSDSVGVRGVGLRLHHWVKMGEKCIGIKANSTK